MGLALGSALNVYTLSLFGPPLLAEFGWTKAQFALGSSFSLISLFFIPFIGRFVDRVGPRIAEREGINHCYEDWSGHAAVSGTAGEPGFDLEGCEATRYLMVWMVFLGLGLALARGRQIAMTSYLARFPDGVRRLVRSTIDLVGLAFSLYIVWFGVDITLLVLASGQSSPTLGVSNAILYLSLPVGFALLAARYAASLFGVIDRWSPGDGVPGH